MELKLSRRDLLRVPPALAALALPISAHAEPRTGATFPSVSGRDLLDRNHTSGEFNSRKMFVTAITATEASEPMRAWLNEAESRYQRGGPIVALVALNLSFIAFDGIVRSQARSHTPAWRHGYVWLDRDGRMGRELGLPDANHVPWVFVVDHGRVTAAVHGPVNSGGAGAIWAAMESGAPSAAPSGAAPSAAPSGAAPSAG